MTGEEDSNRLRKRLGEEKYEFMLQLFGYFEDKLVHNDGIQSTSISDTSYAHKSEVNYLNKELEEMKKQMNELKERITMLEKYSSIPGNLL